MRGRQFRVERDGLPALEFHGQQLATVSSKTASKRRWTELDLFRTDGGAFIKAVRGMSSVDGEVTIHSAHVYADAETCIEQITGERRDRGQAGALALALLDDAGSISRELQTALERYESGVERIN